MADIIDYETAKGIPFQEINAGEVRAYPLWAMDQVLRAIDRIDWHTDGNYNYKYVSVRFDTRSGYFTIYNRNDVPVLIEDVVRAAAWSNKTKKLKRRY